MATPLMLAKLMATRHLQKTMVFHMPQEGTLRAELQADPLWLMQMIRILKMELRREELVHMPKIIQ